MTIYYGRNQFYVTGPEALLDLLAVSAYYISGLTLLFLHWVLFFSLFLPFVLHTENSPETVFTNDITQTYLRLRNFWI